MTFYKYSLAVLLCTIALILAGPAALLPIFLGWRAARRSRVRNERAWLEQYRNSSTNLTA